MNSSLPSARLRPFKPQPFGRYTLLSHLATGGMGEIYLARLEGAQGFEKLCVIKKILPQLAEDSEFVERFVGEARTLVKLSHGSIAQVLDMGLHEGEAYMALEYVDGKDLRKVAGRVRDRQSPLPLTFVLYVMARVLDALAYAHRKRDDDEREIHLVHRDISPQNILISYEGEVKVIDFGLAKSRLSAAKTNPSIILGKFLYMSPEQARHQPVDRRSDLYAVGLCLYELISGKNPFDSVHPGELMTAVAHPRIAPLNEVEPMTPPGVAQVVMKALAVEPSQRFQTAEEFRGRMMACLQEIDSNAGPESVSRFMRELFSAEYQGERKLLAQLKDVPRTAEPARPVAVMEPPLPRVLNPALPPRTIRLDGPVEPLSFQPTPRSRDGAPVEEGETRPGVVVEESTRPAIPTDTLPSIEIQTDPSFRPEPPLSAVPLGGSGSNMPTVEVPIPIVPAAAIPPGMPPPPPRSAEPPRPPPPRTVEPPRPPPPASPTRTGLYGSLPPASAPASRPEPQAAVEPSRAPTLQISSPFDASEEVPTTSEAAPAAPSFEALGLPSAPPPSAPWSPPPPVPEPPRDPPRSRPLPFDSDAIASRPTQPLNMLSSEEMASADSARRGLDDTHPSYKMAAGARRADTQPRVVLDETALNDEEGTDGDAEVVVGGLLEEEAPPAAQARAKAARRPRMSSPGVPTVGRGASPVPPRGGGAHAEPSAPDEGDEFEPRDPRDDTRRTPIPTRPGEPAGKIHRENTRRTPLPVPPKKRSWGWLAVSFVLLLVVGAAVVFTLPELKPLLLKKLGEEQVSRPPPAVPLRPTGPVPPPPGNPATASVQAPAPSGAPAAGAPAAAASPSEEEAASALALEGEMLVPLTDEPDAPSAPAPAKKAPPRPAKKATRKEANELQRDWTQTRNAFTKLTQDRSCDSPRIGILCKRYETLEGEVLEIGDAYDKETHNRVKKLRKALQDAM